MKEEFLHYIWRTHKWFNTVLETTDQKRIEVIYPGDYNIDQGPDFNYAKIAIDGVVWMGQIEMHLRSSDWLRHQHTDDPRYHNIILHVVWEHDVDVTVNDRNLETLVLKNYISNEEIIRYQRLIESEDQIPCEKLFSQIPSYLVISQMENASILRLEEKTNRIKKELEENNNDWEEIFYKNICKYLVTPPNADAMEVLTNKIPWKLIQKLKSNLYELEALLFGTAGMLSNAYDETYIIELKNYFKHLQQKYEIKEMNIQSWHFLRLRPAHFPSIRIAQLASFFHHFDRPFAQILELNSTKELYSALQMEVSEYWKSHYIISKLIESVQTNNLGKSTKDVIIINVLIPLIYTYGIINSQPNIVLKALDWLENLKSENNSYTRRWELIGFKAINARQSQGGIQQFKKFCFDKKCLNCKIGHYILNKN